MWQKKTVKLVLTSLLVLTATVYAARATVSIVDFKVGGGDGVMMLGSGSVGRAASESVAFKIWLSEVFDGIPVPDPPAFVFLGLIGVALILRRNR